MPSYETFIEICERPYEDGPRLQFADEIEGADPAWARYIRAMVEAGQRYRAGDSWAHFAEEPKPEQVRRWAQNTATYLPSPRAVQLVRGFVMGVCLHPLVFCENADAILRTNPIRYVTFVSPYDDRGETIWDAPSMPARFPLEELLACPALAKLDGFGFSRCSLPDDAGQQLAASPNMGNCLYLEFRDTPMSEQSMIALAEGPHTRRLLSVWSEDKAHVGMKRIPYHDDRPGSERFGYSYRFEFSEKGRELEQRHGYIPWLHENYTGLAPFDLRWRVDNGRAPKVPAGTLPVREEWYSRRPTRCFRRCAGKSCRATRRISKCASGLMTMSPGYVSPTR